MKTVVYSNEIRAGVVIKVEGFVIIGTKVETSEKSLNTAKEPVAV